MCWTWKKLITLGSSWYTSNFKRLITRMLNEKWVFRMNWFLVNSLWVYIDINQSSSEFIPNCLIQIVVLSYFITTLVTNGMFWHPGVCLLSPPRPILDQGVGQTHLDDQANLPWDWLIEGVGMMSGIYKSISHILTFCHAIPSNLTQYWPFKKWL